METYDLLWEKPKEKNKKYPYLKCHVFVNCKWKIIIITKLLLLIIKKLKLKV